MTKLIVRRAARLDVRSIREWYEAEEVGLGDRFLAELDGVVERSHASSTNRVSHTATPD
jgi:hypothetical protein